jgi:translation elongation factor EF-G
LIHADRPCIRNIGLLAHVDAGKTTTTEQMLFHAGQIRRAGRVDDGTARTDSMDVERALRVIDGAILILSAVEGVQAHTETLWHALRARGIPTILFINKLDRQGADPRKVLEQVRTVLTNRTVVAQAVPATEQELHEMLPSDSADLLAQMAEWDEESLARWVSGISALLDGVIELLPPPPAPATSNLAGVVFKVERDTVMGRVGYVRLYSGELGWRVGELLLPGQFVCHSAVPD